jgi:YVTN family beta-propeller protein
MLVLIGTTGAFAVQEVTDGPDEVASHSAALGSPSATVKPSSPSITPAGSAGRSGGGVYAAITTDRLSPAVQGIKPLVYVPNNGSNTVDVIDPTTFRIVGHFPVGDEPQHITPSWDLKHLYVGNTYSNTLTVIDPGTGKPTGTIPVFDAYNLYFTPDGSEAIDVAERMNTLFFYNWHTWKVIDQIRIPFGGADHLDFSADGHFLFISTEYAGRLVKIDVGLRKIVGSVALRGSPVDVKVSPDGSVFFVANQIRNGVSVVDPNRMKEIEFIPTGEGAHGFCVSRDARFLYVSNRLAGTISVLSFATRKVVRTWDVGGSPDMMQVTPDGTQLWVSNRYNGTVFVVDTGSGKVLHVIKVGAAPHGLTYFPQPGRFSIGHNGVYR